MRLILPHPPRRWMPARLLRTVRTAARRLGRAWPRRRRLLVVAAAAAVLPVLIAPSSAHAQQLQQLAAEDSLEAVLNNIRNWIMGIAATLATVMLSIGGVIRMMAGGDPGEIERSNRAFKSAAYGYGIAALAPLVVEILKGIVGE